MAPGSRGRPHSDRPFHRVRKTRSSSVDGPSSFRGIPKGSYIFGHDPLVDLTTTKEVALAHCLLTRFKRESDFAQMVETMMTLLVDRREAKEQTVSPLAWCEKGGLYTYIPPFVISCFENEKLCLVPPFLNRDLDRKHSWRGTRREPFPPPGKADHIAW